MTRDAGEAASVDEALDRILEQTGEGVEPERVSGIPSAGFEACRVRSMRVAGFRNFDAIEFEPGARFNVIWGDNGQGKSNLLEAIYYLATLCSFRGASLEDMLRQGSARADLSAFVSAGEAFPRHYRAQFGNDLRAAFQIDGKRPRSRAVYRAGIHATVFHPGGIELVTGTGGARRDFLDRLLEHIDSVYAASLEAYDKALRSRNRLLQESMSNDVMLSAYDALLSQHGAIIGRARAEIVRDLQADAREAFASIIGEENLLTLEYAPNVEPDAGAILRALEERRTLDRERGFTTRGPHRDDLQIDFRDTAARRFASQGQHRSIVLALKVAEVGVLKRRTGFAPMMLLDDVSSELDRTRSRNLFQLFERVGAQVFITTTHPEFILLDRSRSDFRIEAGHVLT